MRVLRARDASMLREKTRHSWFKDLISRVANRIGFFFLFFWSRKGFGRYYRKTFVNNNPALKRIENWHRHEVQTLLSILSTAHRRIFSFFFPTGRGRQGSHRKERWVVCIACVYCPRAFQFVSWVFFFCRNVRARDDSTKKNSRDRTRDAYLFFNA